MHNPDEPILPLFLQLAIVHYILASIVNASLTKAVDTVAW